jgi:hypothetical protein
MPYSLLFLFIPKIHSKALFYTFYKDSSIAYIKTVSPLDKNDSTAF